MLKLVNFANFLKLINLNFQCMGRGISFCPHPDDTLGLHSRLQDNGHGFQVVGGVQHAAHAH